MRQSIESLSLILKYPKAVFFIIVAAVVEKCSVYGIRTVLSVYLITIVGFTESTSVMVYHTFILLFSFFAIFGGMLADSLLGKFKTAIYSTIVYLIGSINLTLASIDGPIGIPVMEISMLGLFLIALGIGGMKPSVAAFGADQFLLPQQQAELERYFSFSYFFLNVGLVIIIYIAPNLTSQVKCFGMITCYPLTFGVSTCLMIIALVILLLGMRFYIIKMPTEIIVVRIFRIICNAISVKCKSTEKKQHWLDHAEQKFGKKPVTDLKFLLKVLTLYIPMPIFWTLYDQQGSRWNFQAMRMNGGHFDTFAEPIQMVNPLMVVILVPTFEYGIYPLLAKCDLLTNTLTRMKVGCALAGVSFIIAALLEIWLEPTYAMLPMAGNAQLMFYNAFDCDVKLTVDIPGGEDHIIKALGLWEVKNIPAKSENEKELTVTMDDVSCGPVSEYKGSVTFSEKTASSHLITKMDGAIVVKGNMDLDDLEKFIDFSPKIRIIYSFIDPNKSRNLVLSVSDGKDVIFNLTENQVGTKYQNVTLVKYSVKIDDQKLKEINLELGGVYSLFISETVRDKYEARLNVITSPNTVSLMWLFPQYFVMAVGEVMYIVSIAHFSYAQTPVNMKTVTQSVGIFTHGVGNLIILIITQTMTIDRKMYEFLLYAGLMLVNMVIFIVISWNYQYIDLHEIDDVVEEEDEEEEINH